MTAWSYSQKSGEMTDPRGVVVEVGYSGAPGFVNRPIAERREDEGPLPTGSYTILPAIDHENLGPVAMPLEPAPENEMHGRSGFYIHGDNAAADESASMGCIILSRDTRDMIDASDIRDLVVTI